MIVDIFPNCIGCGVCEAINSEVFTINKVAHINDDFITGNEDDCRHAAELCPVSAINIIEED